MKDGIVNKNYDFDQNFKLSPSTPSLKTVGERVKLIKPADISYKYHQQLMEKKSRY